MNSAWQEEYPEVQNDGVGPGLYFAQEMQVRTGGVPQGVISCAVGGASLWQWSPNGTNNYYTAALRRFKECGGNIRGVFWHQGESQAGSSAEAFVADMKTLVGAMREDFNDSHLPFVQVQIHRYYAGADAAWTVIREAQRTLGEHIDNLATVYSLDSELDDLIHLSSESQVKVGKRAGEAMAVLLGYEGVASPEIDRFEIVQDEYKPFCWNIMIHYKNIVGELEALGVPSGYYICNSSGQQTYPIVRTILKENTVRLVLELSAEAIGQR